MATAQVVTTKWIELGEDKLRWDVAWKSTDLGVVSVVLTGSDLAKVFGWYLFMTKSDPDGTTVPSAAWDWTIKDDHGIDLMGGLGADTSETAGVLKIPKLDGTNYGDVIVDSELTFAIAAAGDAKKGVNSFYFRKNSGR